MTRAGVLLAALAAALIALPWFGGAYALSVATLILYFAYTGQAWNVMMGFAGQLSLGHAIYVGVGGYAAGALLGGVLIGVSEALAGLLIVPSAKSMFSFALLILVLLFRPQGLLGRRV